MWRAEGFWLSSYQVRSTVVMRVRLVVGLIAAVIIVGGIASVSWIARRGFSARDEPSDVEKIIARGVRRMAVPRRASEMKNPVTLTPDVLADARAHFADHCAICHANDGGGN